MTNFLKILLFFLVLFAIYAPSCVDEQELARRKEIILDEAIDEIQAEFETEYLSEASLFAFEEKAKQKLSDFADYLHIMSDTSLDISFRMRAGEMIKSTFLSEQNTVFLESTHKNFEVGHLINLCIKNHFVIPKFTIDSIAVNEPLHRSKKHFYTGSLSFVQKITKASLPNNTPYSPKTIAHIYILKENKVFGTDTVRVWNVRLGNIQ